ncbi:unnamed protein product [Bursaphelenchus xylophilus]|uniref:(pine wood nematode) hypothetical protein n=1 Tax=Bursaphelenchus xylophilus TaxID=6326 RepID=A0A1I7S6R1_BURXY|nr:unnamed protein product [Bursaphelenchus xylophilus]CAG9120695.1 unnamed protein product [Bursaphelenchus xylophilus]
MTIKPLYAPRSHRKHKSSGNPIYIALEHSLGTVNNGHVFGDVDVLFRVHASVEHKAFYGLNVTNSIISNNTANGISARDITDRLALTNVTADGNQGYAGLYVHGGAGDIWINDTSLSHNWGDGMNVTFAGGSINLNSSRVVGNRWRGVSVHYNTSLPYFSLHNEVVIKGRPANNLFYPKMLIAQNLWGGVLIGNYCRDADEAAEYDIRPRVQINWVHFDENFYHPHMDIFACQENRVAQGIVDITGNSIIGGSGMGFRMEPAVNTHLIINSNRFHNIQNAAMVVRNAKHPQLKHLPAKVEIYKNDIKMNVGQFIVAIGMNEDAPKQSLIFSQQNEVRANTVINPFPFLRPRSTPYAAVVVSSSNVKINYNCFGNPKADFELGVELMEHAKRIDAKNNNWGDADARNFLHRIFDQFNRYSLAAVDLNPYAAVCNQRSPNPTFLQQTYRHFRRAHQPFVIGGTIFENSDLQPGKYTVTDDLHISPGAKLTISHGTELEFLDGVGMLVQGELIRNDYSNPFQPIKFTSKPFQLPHVENIRLVDDWGNEDVFSGRLEIKIEGQWGTVCNRSWTASHAQLACNQLGLTMDPQYFENWRIFVDKGDLPMLVDNIRCEEREWDLTQCRRDGTLHNVQASCRPTEVVGLRCAQPHWAGVRYSLLANPPSITGQTTMNNWIIERAGLFDFRTSTFSPALQIDWNYHTFHGLVIRDNFDEGLDIVYNDLTKKPAIRHSRFERNRRDGIRLRSVGLTIEEVTIKDNQNAGVRYNPSISESLQRDIVSWLDRKEQPELEANNVHVFPNRSLNKLQVHESQLNHRRFLVARATPDCPLVSGDPCSFEMQLEAQGYEYGITSKLVVQLVNRPNNESDEDVVLVDHQGHKVWSARKNPIDFPIQSAGPSLTLRYSRSYGAPKVILLVLFLDTQEYLDKFVHVYQSVIDNNQYGVSAIHYSNLTFDDGTVLNRWSEEKLWFQKVNFTNNKEAVVWIHSPQHGVVEGTPLADITWHIDNCSIHHNAGPIIDTHRDLFASANIFHWNFWSNTFENNTDSGVNVVLPDTYDLLSHKEHTFWMTENRFQGNTGFYINLGGYHCFANISSNNVTDNFARPDLGIMSLNGMEKRLVMERNRFFNNWGHWMVRIDTDSQYLRSQEVPSYVQYNYFQFNKFVQSLDDYVDSWPRSFCVGAFGTQKVDVHYNRLKNKLMDFEIVAGVRPQRPAIDVMNITYNWYGVANEAGVAQRIFDVDDWNIFSVGNYSPFYSSEEQFLNFWWEPQKGQLIYADPAEPNELDLKGRMYQSKNLSLNPERWYKFPYVYRPFRPYRVTRDLTIMPGATLTIERNVEVHVWPNVRILVLGNLIADGTLWQPIRFKPINATEWAEEQGTRPTRYRRHTTLRRQKRRIDLDQRHEAYVKRRKRATPQRFDPVYNQFPTLRREDPFHQDFRVLLSQNGSILGRSGFLELYNATTGEIVPSCDQQFTARNAMVVCRELGYRTQNAYHWITPRYDYNPQIRLVKTYMEPRECRGNERRLAECPLRLAANDQIWMCMNTIFHNYIHCGDAQKISTEYFGQFGGITFAHQELDLIQEKVDDSSVLRHVEIVGGGQAHNDSYQTAALQIVRRNPILENVNVTNSSMHGLQIIAPRENVILTRLNISDNPGQGLNILSMNLQAAQNGGQTSKGPLNLPYNVPGMLDVCSGGKEVMVGNRILVYYKYDSKPVDCVKVFKSKTAKNLGFRFLQVNIYSANNPLGRPDALSLYSDDTFRPISLLVKYDGTSTGNPATTIANYPPISSRSTVLGLHLRATAADGEFGFIAEVAALPSAPDSRQVDEISLRNSRFHNNDRGAVQYRNVGEVGPNLIMEQCLAQGNGYFLFGNVSTSAQAVELHLHNTILLLFRANALHENQGGLLVTAESSSAVARLNAVVKNSAFTMNRNSTALAFLGNDYQRVTLLNNIISKNYALYFDTCLVQGMSVNFTRNVFSNNTGTHTVDTQGYSQISSDAQYFYENFFENNVALGHGNQYVERFGFLPEFENEEFNRRPKRRAKRQVINQRGVSFDWWTHVGRETGRYRSTILSGSAAQKLERNVFNNPGNPYELTTSAQTQFDTGAVDAMNNYWGYPGTPGVAAGKIRDQADYPYLVKVNYIPVLDSNTSLIEGDCPAGWFQVGNDEFKSCFLFVGASMTYHGAVGFCEDLDAFMPILRADDTRQKDLARRVDFFGQHYITEAEKYNSMGHSFDIPIWISSVTLPSNQCGWLSSRTGSIGEQNCNNLLPFVCEKGTRPYKEPILWRRDLVFVAIALLLLALLILFLLICACRRAKKREKQFKAQKLQFREGSLRKKSPYNPRAMRNGAPPNSTDIFDAMNPQANVANVAKLQESMRKHNSLTKNKKNLAATTVTSSSCTSSSVTYESTDYCSRTNCDLSTENTYSSLTQSPPPAYKTDTMRSKGLGTSRSKGVSLRPDPYDLSTLRSAGKKGCQVNSTFDSEANSTYVTCSNCSNSSRTYSSTYYCSTCTADTNSVADSEATLTEAPTVLDTLDEEVSSRSSNSTVTAEKPLIKPPRNLSGRSQGTIPIATPSSTLMASSRTDSTLQPNPHASARSQHSGLPSTRSNPNLAQIPQQFIPRQPQKVAELESEPKRQRPKSGFQEPPPPYSSQEFLESDTLGRRKAQPTSLNEILRKSSGLVMSPVNFQTQPKPPPQPQARPPTMGYINMGFPATGERPQTKPPLPPPSIQLRQRTQSGGQTPTGSQRPAQRPKSVMRMDQGVMRMETSM